MFDVDYFDPADVLLGGAISANPLGTQAGVGDWTATAAQFAAVTSEQVLLNSNYYHRKVWLTNQEAVDIQSPEIWFEDVEYPDQLSIAHEQSADDVTTDPYEMPTGYETSQFHNAVTAEDRIALQFDSSDFTAGTDVAVWVRMSVPAGHVADASAFGTLKLRGIRGV